MILGDSLQVMASLAEREGLRGKVQCIYLVAIRLIQKCDECGGIYVALSLYGHRRRRQWNGWSGCGVSARHSGSTFTCRVGEAHLESPVAQTRQQRYPKSWPLSWLSCTRVVRG